MNAVNTAMEPMAQPVTPRHGSSRSSDRRNQRTDDQPMISLSPSTIRARSSSDAWASRRPMRSVLKVRTCPILAHDRLDKPAACTSNVSGNPARGSD